MKTPNLILMFFILASPLPLQAFSLSPIHQIDFRNFTFPGKSNGPSFRLTNGKTEFASNQCFNEVAFESIIYSDLTGDRHDEAVVNLRHLQMCGSSGVANHFYVFTMQGKKLQLIGQFSTGVQAQGGLKTFSVTEQRLSLELYGDYGFLGGRIAFMSQEKTSDCCPQRYSQIELRYENKKWVQESRKVFPYAGSIFEKH